MATFSTRQGLRKPVSLSIALMRASDMTLLDVQWCTPHLESLGVTEVSRPDYLVKLRAALGL